MSDSHGNLMKRILIQELGEMAELTFRGPDNTVYIKGSDVSRSQVAVDQQKNYVVELEFSSEGAKKFADATEKLVGQQMGIEQNRCAMACQGCGIAIFCFL